MKLRFIVAVADFDVQGLYMKTVRVREFRNLAIARRYEAKFYRKALSTPNRIGRIQNWGSDVHNFVNGANFADVRSTEDASFMHPVRTITITCRSF